MVDHWPQENGRAEIQKAEASGGGAACNVAINLRKLAPALPVATIGLVGNDLDGRFLLGQADAHAIDRRQIAVTGAAATDYTFAVSSRDTGQRTHFSYCGTSDLLTPDHFNFAGADHRVLHLGLPGLHRTMDGPWRGEANGWVAVLKAARAAGLETNLELPGVAPERLAALVRPCLPYLDFLIVNEAEIAGVSGVETVDGRRADPEACIAAAKVVLAAGPLSLVVVHFPMGAILVDRAGTVLARPSVRIPQDEIKGANGAGDAFAAGFLFGIHEGWSREECLSLAHATAAASLRQISASGAVESWSGNLDFAGRRGWRDSHVVGPVACS